MGTPGLVTVGAAGVVLAGGGTVVTGVLARVAPVARIAVPVAAPFVVKSSDDVEGMNTLATIGSFGITSGPVVACKAVGPETTAFKVIVRDGQPVVQLPALNIDMDLAGSSTIGDLPNLPEALQGEPTLAATPGSTVVSSGVHSPYPNAAVDLWNASKESGLPLRPNPFFDKLPNLGAEGTYASTHAEVKALFNNPSADIVVVNRNPCVGCRCTISSIAAGRQTPITVLAPNGIYNFMPDGSVVLPNGTVILP
jgi:hypothetical protein